MEIEIQKFISGKRHKNVSPHTMIAYQRILTLFDEYLHTVHNRDVAATEVTTDDILKYMDHKYPDMNKRVSARNNTLTIMHRFFFENNMNPLCQYISNIKPLYAHDKKVPFKADELRAAITIAKTNNNLRDVAILTLLPSSGLRSVELLKLRYKDFDFENCIGYILGKGRKEGEKPELFVYSEEARDAILAYLKTIPRPDSTPDILLFNEFGIDSVNWRKAYDTMRNHFRREYGIWQFHRCRHYFGNEAISKYPLRVVQKLLRHKDVKSTEIYLHEGDDKIINEYKKNPVIVKK
jgi:integrase/recombinase XerD